MELDFRNASKKALSEAAEKGARAAARLKNLRSKAEEQMGHTVAVAETAVTSFGFGYLRGYKRDFEIAGLPPDLIAGVGMTLMGFAGAFGRYDRDAFAIGAGALASYANAKGLEMGARQLQEDGGAPAAAGWSGQPAIGYGGPAIGAQPTAFDLAQQMAATA